jgi:hypothetical protein
MPAPLPLPKKPEPIEEKKEMPERELPPMES